MAVTPRIERILSIEELTLMVFYTPAHYWQFSYINRKGKALKYCGIFYSSLEAELAGRKWIKGLLNS